jgi:hypothetical protein
MISPISLDPQTSVDVNSVAAEHGMEVEVQIHPPVRGAAQLSLTLASQTLAGVRPGRITVHLRLAGGRFEETYVQSWSTGGETGVRPGVIPARSSGVAGWSSPAAGRAVVCGFLDHSYGPTWIESHEGPDGSVDIVAVCDREDTAISEDGVIQLPGLWISSGSSLVRLLEAYAEEVSQRMGVRVGGPLETGWCSWYYYYGKESFEDVVRDADALRSSPIGAQLRTIQIDDGWNRAAARNVPDDWGEWAPHPDKFPEGMAAAAQRIHQLGYRAGLWLAPFSIEKSSTIFREHPEWLVQRLVNGAAEPAPIENGPVYSLDCTQPGALNWLRETFSRVFHEWGFDYVKIDFLQHGAFRGVRHDSSATSIGAFRRGLETIREVAGPDRFVLGCGAPLLASIGLVDGMRVGPDVGGRWYMDFGSDRMPVGNCSIRSAAIPSLWSQWMQGRWWQNDPDCLVVRASSGRFEFDFFQRIESSLPDSQLKATPLGLTEEEAACWARLVWMTGGMTLLSEVWGELGQDRRGLLEKCFPPHGRISSLLDWHVGADAGGMVLFGEPLTVGFFNLSESPVRPVFDSAASAFPANATWTERWSGETCQTDGLPAIFPELPPRSGRVWQLLPHPEKAGS